MVNAGQVTIGDVTIPTTPFASGTQTQDYQEVGEGTHPIAAGKYKVTIYNEGLSVITVNGDSVPIGDKWEVEAVSNTNTQRFDLTPAISIVVADALGKATYSWTGPSA